MPASTNTRIARAVASEAARFFWKDPSKFKLIAGLYALSLYGPERGRATRSAYFVLRHIDDVCDGELTIPDDVEQYVTGIRDAIATGEFDTDVPIEIMAQQSLEFLERVKRPEDDPRSEFLDAIEGMLTDFRRRVNRQTLPARGILTQHRRGIGPATNLLLIGLQSNLRSKDLQDYAINLDRLYAVRDIQKDWKLGLINIPFEVLENAKLTPEDSIDDVLCRRAVRTFMETEMSEASIGLRQTQRVLDERADKHARRILGGLIRSALRVKLPVFDYFASR